MPYGTKSSSVLAKIVAKNSGVVVLKSTTEEKFTYYNSNDSIDFSTPRVLRVYSNKGSEYRDYKVTVNVHKQKGNVFSWETLQANSNFASFTAMRPLVRVARCLSSVPMVARPSFMLRQKTMEIAGLS